MHHLYEDPPSREFMLVKSSEETMKNAAWGCLLLTVGVLCGIGGFALGLFLKLAF